MVGLFVLNKFYSLSSLLQLLFIPVNPLGNKSSLHLPVCLKRLPEPTEASRLVCVVTRATCRCLRMFVAQVS